MSGENRLKARCDIYEKWTIAFSNGENVGDRLYDQGYRRVAIYAMGDLGWLLEKELKKSKIEIMYVIDRNDVYSDLPLKKPTDALEKVDAIIVAFETDFENIKHTLEKVCDCEIIALIDLLTWR